MPSSRTHYYDLRTPGLLLRVEVSGSKTFYFSKRLGRSMKQIKLGPFPQLELNQARAKAIEMSAAVVMGKDPATAGVVRRGEPTLRETFAWYMEVHARPRKRERTCKLDEMNFRLYFAPLASKSLTAISRHDVRSWHAELVGSKGAPTANNALKLLSSIFGRAIAHDRWEGANPCQRIEKAHEQSRDRRLMPGEINDFMDALEADHDLALKDYIYLSLFTGQRRGNILAMRWDEIDLIGRTWRIPLTKNGQPQHVPLEEQELTILMRRKEGSQSPWVFPGSGATGHLVEPKKGWARILNRANEERTKRNEPPISDLRIHDLRRTLGSYMVDTGASLHIVGKTLGHKNQATTAIYARLSLEPVRSAKRAAINAMRNERLSNGGEDSSL
ncbi:site-specific tyrosine recombinase XerD [compost metagenome]